MARTLGMSPSVSSPASPARILGASLAGTAVEFFDFYIYATAASLVFGPLFFPSSSASAQLLAAYATFSVAFFARPLGAVAFGHFGDRIGRKSTLVVSLLLMGGSTFAVGLLPGYAVLGWVAPFFLCLLRFGQGFGLGGEWGGAALLAVENAPPEKRARYGIFPQLGAPVGFIAANGLYLLIGLFLNRDAFLSFGWRIPFLMSSVLVGLGLWVRLRLSETPAFAALVEHGPQKGVPLVSLLSHHARPTLFGALGVICCFALFYLSTAFALGYGVTTLKYPRNAFLGVQLGAMVFLALGIWLSGEASDRWGPRRVLAAGCAATIGAGFVYAPLMASGSLVGVFSILSLALFIMGFTYGPLSAWLSDLFPARVRYSGTSVAFNVGGVLGGALTPIFAQMLASQGGLKLVGLYLSAAGALSLIGVAAAGKGAKIQEL